MSIDLNAFRNIAGSDISIGYAVAKTDDKGNASLEKAAAHRHLQSWNVVPADSESNAELRLSLYGLVQDALNETGLDPQDAMVKAFLSRIAEKLGCSLGADGQMHAEAKPLERRVIRSVLNGLDAHLAFFNKADLSKLTPEMLGALANTFDKTLDDVATLGSAKAPSSVRLREALTSAAQSLLGGIGLKDGDLTNVSTVRIQEMIVLALDGRDLQTPEELADLLAVFKLSADVNSEEIQNLVVKMDAVGQEELNHVNDEGPAVKSRALSSQERQELAAKVATEAIQAGVKAARKAVSWFSSFFNADKDSPVKVENPPAPVEQPVEQSVEQPVGQPAVQPEEHPENHKGPFGTTVGDVQDMLADMVFDSDTIATDSENGAKGKHMADVLTRHVKTVAACLVDKALIAGLPANLRGVANDMMNKILADEGIMAKLGELKPERVDVIAFEIDLALKTPMVQDKLAEFVETMESTIDEMAGEAQDKINEALDSMFPENGKGEKAVAHDGPPSAQKMLVSGEFKTLNELVKAPEFEAKESQDTKLSLQGKTYNEVSVKESDGTVHTYISDEIASASTTIGNVQVAPKQLKEAEKAVIKARAQQKQTRAKVGQLLINKMLEKTVQDTSSGYTAFMIGSLKTYLTGMSTVDRRAMVAAAFRYAKPDVKPKYPEGATKEMKEEIDAEVARKNSIQLFGAMMKGAGPIMQKMLQGLASATDDEAFLLALADMRSNLAPISPKIVKANLASMIADSNGQIKDITIRDSLGAASVGQAFLCRITLQDPADANKTVQKDVVVKMLRPDAEQRMLREKGIFEKAAAKVSGMSVTFAGQLESLMEELDLRVEAENTKAGAVYDKGVKDVKSMKVLDVVKPTKYLLVVEKAPGESVTVDRLMKNTADKLKSILSPFKPETKWSDQDKKLVTNYTNPDHNFKTSMDMKAKAEKELLNLYEQTLVQQKRLVTLARKWVQEGVYSSGYYHGDLHAGNIMVDTKFKLAADGSLARNKKGVPDLSENKGLTVIDFGNATKLSDDQQKSIIKMMAATAAKDVDAYLDGFYNLMTEGGRAGFAKDRAKIANMVKSVFNLGTQAESGQRIALTLQMLQQMGHELPAPIFKFSQCQMRLQGTIDQMNALLGKIKDHYFGLLRSGSVSGTSIGFGCEKIEPVCVFNEAMRGGGTDKVDVEVAYMRRVVDRLRANPDDPELAKSKYVLSSLFNVDSTDNVLRGAISSGETGVDDIFASYFDNVLTVATDEQKAKFTAVAEKIRSRAKELKIDECIEGIAVARRQNAEAQNRKGALEVQILRHGSLIGLRDSAQSYFERGFTVETLKARQKELGNRVQAGALAYGEPDFDEYVKLTPLVEDMDAHPNYLEYLNGEIDSFDVDKAKKEIEELTAKMAAISAPTATLRERVFAFSAEVQQLMKTVDIDYLETSIRHLQNRKGELVAEMNKRDPRAHSLATMNEAVGNVIADNKFSSLLKIGVGTALDYQLGGKLTNEQNPV